MRRLAASLVGLSLVWACSSTPPAPQKLDSACTNKCEVKFEECSPSCATLQTEEQQECKLACTATHDGCVDECAGLDA